MGGLGQSGNLTVTSIAELAARSPSIPTCGCRVCGAPTTPGSCSSRDVLAIDPITRPLQDTGEFIVAWQPLSLTRNAQLFGTSVNHALPRIPAESQKWQALVRQSGRAYYHTRGQTSRTRHCHRIAHHTTSRPRGPGQNKTDREAAGDGEQHTEFYRAARGCQRRVRTFPRNLWRALEHMRAHLMEAIRSVVPRLGDTQSKRNTRAEPGICAPRCFCGQYNNSTIEDDG